MNNMRTSKVEKITGCIARELGMRAIKVSGKNNPICPSFFFDEPLLPKELLLLKQLENK